MSTTETLTLHWPAHISTADVDIEVQYECLTIEVQDFEADARISISIDDLDAFTDAQLQWLVTNCTNELTRRTVADTPDGQED